MTMLSNQELIRRVPLFSMLTPAQAEMITQTVTKKRIKRGEYIVQQGEKSNALYIILNGRARVLSADAKGREVILAVLRPCAHVGEMSLIDNEPHSATVEAEVQTDLMVLGRQEFARCMADSPSMAYAIMRALVQRLRVADGKIHSLALMDVYGRVARVLLETCETDANGVQTIRDKVSRQDVAKTVGASREMVSRVMKDLEDRGFIQMREDGSMLLRPDLYTFQ